METFAGICGVGVSISLLLCGVICIFAGIAKVYDDKHGYLAFLDDARWLSGLAAYIALLYFLVDAVHALIMTTV